MEMGLQNVFHLSASCFCHLQITIYLSQWIQYAGFTVALNIVGEGGQAANLKLLNVKVLCFYYIISLKLSTRTRSFGAEG